MMDEDFEIAQPRTGLLWLAGALALAWLIAGGLAVLMLAGMVSLPGLQTPLLVAAGLLLLAAPAAVLWLVASRLADTRAFQGRRAALVADHALFTERKLDQAGDALAQLEARSRHLADTLEAMAAPLGQQHDGLARAIATLESAAARLGEATEATEAATRRLGEATPAATAQAENLVGLLDTGAGRLNDQLGKTETLLAALHVMADEASSDADAAVQRTSEGLDAIAAAAARARESLDAPLAALRGAADEALARTTQAVDTTRDAVHAQTNAMLASVDQARVTLDHIGGEAARAIQERLDLLLGSAGQLEGRLQEQAELARAFVEQVARDFGVLDAKLGNSVAGSGEAMESLAARLAEARDAIHRLGDPIAETETALVGLETRLAGLGDSNATTMAAVQSAVPAAMPALDSMAARLGELHASAGALQMPIQEGTNALGSAQDRLDMAREALSAASVTLSQELESARDLIQQIETATGNVGLQASTELIEAFARVRDVAQQTAGTMRTTLSGIVAEAEQALDRAGTTRAEAAFAAPIRGHIADLETAQERAAAAAQAAAERITQRLLGLTQTIAGVEARIDEVETRLDIRARNTLARRAETIINGLNGAAVDMARLLDFDIEDQAWDAYAGGDRSIIARRLADRLNDGAGKLFIRHFQHDQEFRHEAIRFAEDFEALVSQTANEREGKALGVTLLSSTLGKLYLTIAEASGRLN